MLKYSEIKMIPSKIQKQEGGFQLNNLRKFCDNSRLLSFNQLAIIREKSNIKNVNRNSVF